MNVKQEFLDGAQDWTRTSMLLKAPPSEDGMSTISPPGHIDSYLSDSDRIFQSIYIAEMQYLLPTSKVSRKLSEVSALISLKQACICGTCSL